MARVIPAPAGGARPVRGLPPVAAAAAGTGPTAAERGSEFPKTLAAATTGAPTAAPRADAPERPAEPRPDTAAKAEASAEAAVTATAVDEGPAEEAGDAAHPIPVATDIDVPDPTDAAPPPAGATDEVSEPAPPSLRPVLRDLPPAPPADDLTSPIHDSSGPFGDDVLVQEDVAPDADVEEVDVQGEPTLDGVGPMSAPFSAAAVPAEAVRDVTVSQPLDAEPAVVPAAIPEGVRPRPQLDGEGSADAPLDLHRPATPTGKAHANEPSPAGAAAATAVLPDAPAAAAGPSLPTSDPTATSVGASAADPAALVAVEPRGPSPSPGAPASTPTLAAEPPLPFEQSFADDNHRSIVTAVRTSITDGGGAVRIRLDPPVLGHLDVLVELRDGALTASFQTSNDDATRLLSHSLGQLRAALEGQGVSVDTLQVHQAPPRDPAGNAGNAGDDRPSQQHQQGGAGEQERHARQEQQRRELMERVWRRLAGGRDPLDVKA